MKPQEEKPDLEYQKTTLPAHGREVTMEIHSRQN